MQPHPAFFTHWFIVCLNPTQSQKQGVCVMVRGRVKERAIRVGHVITTYHQSDCTVAGGIIVPSSARSLASLISPGETQTPPLLTQNTVWTQLREGRGRSVVIKLITAYIKLLFVIHHPELCYLK